MCPYDVLPYRHMTLSWKESVNALYRKLWISSRYSGFLHKECWQGGLGLTLKWIRYSGAVVQQLHFNFKSYIVYHLTTSEIYRTLTWQKPFALHFSYRALWRQYYLPSSKLHRRLPLTFTTYLKGFKWRDKSEARGNKDAWVHGHVV
jgi:hypothetical protein